jgi:hypothetical protein
VGFIASRNMIHQSRKRGGKEMKKFVVLTLFGLLIMAFSATVYAQKLEFKASGTIDFDTVWAMNVPYYFANVAAAHTAHAGLFQTNAGIMAFNPFSGAADRGLNHNDAYAYSRGILRFDAVMSKDLSGTFIFELDAFRWGSSSGWLSNGKGSAGLGAHGGTLTVGSERNTMGVWSTDRAAVEVKNVYIDFGLPYFGIPVPMTVRVGAQPFGVRPNMVVYTDGAGITGGINAGPVTIIPMWAKMGEGLDWNSDDNDLYGLHANAKVGTFTVGGYGLFYKMRTYPGEYVTGANWPTVIGGYTWPIATSSSYGLYMAGTDKANFWWYGLYADGKAGPVNLNADIVWDTGKVKRKKMFDTVGGTGATGLPVDWTFPGQGFDSVKYSGWAGRLKVDFPWEKFNFGVTGMYASGMDANKTSTSGIPGTAVANRGYNALTGALSRKVGGYVVPPGSEQSPSSQESIVMYSCFNAAADGGTGIAQVGNYNSVSRGAFGGTWFAKLYGSAKLLPWYKVTLQGLYIGDTTKNGNTLGTAVKNPFSPISNQLLRDDKKIGWELDVINEIQIYKNLTWFVGGGYLWAGPALDLYNNAGATGASPAATARNIEYRNPWNITTRLLYSF